MGAIEITLVILFIFFIVFPIIIIGFMLTGSRRTSKVINELIKEEQTPVTEKENVEEMWYCPALKMYISVNECKGCLDYFDCPDSKINENR